MSTKQLSYLFGHHFAEGGRAFNFGPPPTKRTILGACAGYLKIHWRSFDLSRELLCQSGGSSVEFIAMQGLRQFSGRSQSPLHCDKIMNTKVKISYLILA